MQIEDLKHIFAAQIEEGTSNLYFMLLDHGEKLISRCQVEQMDTLLPMLDCFQYMGTIDRIPRFSK